MAKPTAPDRARRLMALLHIFEPGTVVEIAQIAEELGAEPAEIEHDLEILACCGLDPFDPESAVPLMVDDGLVTVFGELPALDRPLRLSAAEAQALTVALQSAGMDAADPLAVKLLAAGASASSGADIQQTLRAAASASGFTLRPLILAAKEHRVVTIEYRSYGRETENARTIEPLAVLQDLGIWYVRAYCRETGFVQTFRLDRIKDARLTTETFEPRDIGETSSAIELEGRPVAVLRFARGVNYDPRDWPGSSVTGDGDGEITVAVPYVGTNWIARQVAARLGGIVVVEPDAIRDAVAKLALEEIARL
jgi:proteasome accessory factor C